MKGPLKAGATVSLAHPPALALRRLEEYRRIEEEMMEISEMERRALAHELHDGVCQQLSGLTYMAESLVSKIARKGLAKEAAQLEELVQLLRSANQHTREVARDLHPVDVDANGLVAALCDLAGRNCAANVRCTLECPAPAPVADNEVAMQLFRIAREAVTSAIEHGAATEVTIQIGFRGEVLVLTVADNGGNTGRSCRTSKETALRMMKHRARDIGAALAMTKKPMGGTVVRCTCGGGRAA